MVSKKQVTKTVWVEADEGAWRIFCRLSPVHFPFTIRDAMGGFATTSEASTFARDWVSACGQLSVALDSAQGREVAVHLRAAYQRAMDLRQTA